jgi:hypothetical protein
VQRNPNQGKCQGNGSEDSESLQSCGEFEGYSEQVQNSDLWKLMETACMERAEEKLIFITTVYIAALIGTSWQRQGQRRAANSTTWRRNMTLSVRGTMVVAVQATSPRLSLTG